MKWTKRGHEFDEFSASIKDEFHRNIYIFGAGQIGENTGRCIRAFGILGGFIDNNKERQGQRLLGHTIMSLDKYISENSHIAIVIGVSKKYSLEIAKQLEKENLIHGRDFFFDDEFHNKILPVIATYFLNKTYMNLAQFTLTERCSLKCKKCAHACYNVGNQTQDLDLSEVYKSADMFFSKVDYINEFVLIGGEPLLYKGLSKAIVYIGNKYRSQIGIFSITTNGTIAPDEETLKVCQKYQVLYRISNYAKALPRLHQSHMKLIKKLQEYGIEYKLYDEDGYWIDYGFDYLNKDMDEEELTQTFDRCLTPCREVRGNKLYFCVMARSVSDNLHFNEGQDDYLDLELLKSDNYKKVLLEFNLGYSEKGYLDMCHRCHGIDAVNYPIPIAEQLYGEDK